MKLMNCVTVENNNDACVVLKVKPDQRMNLISLGYFNGNEEMFRLTKGDCTTCTVFYNNGKSFSFHWGLGGHTLVSEATAEMGYLVAECVQKDYGIFCSKYCLPIARR